MTSRTTQVVDNLLVLYTVERGDAAFETMVSQVCEITRGRGRRGIRRGMKAHIMLHLKRPEAAFYTRLQKVIERAPPRIRVSVYEYPFHKGMAEGEKAVAFWPSNKVLDEVAVRDLRAHLAFFEPWDVVLEGHVLLSHLPLLGPAPETKELAGAFVPAED